MNLPVGGMNLPVVTVNVTTVMCSNFEQENDKTSSTFVQMARKIHKNGKINDFLPLRFFKFLAKILKEFISNQNNVLT